MFNIVLVIIYLMIKYEGLFLIFNGTAAVLST